MVTTCGIPTFDPEPPVYFDFDPESASRIVMKVSLVDQCLFDIHLDAFAAAITSHAILLLLTNTNRQNGWRRACVIWTPPATG